jgi:uncharacterized protein (TIGR02271 family)
VAQPLAVQGKDGWSGIIHSWARGSDEITLRLDSGEKLILPASLLTTRPDGSYYAPLSLDEIRGGMTHGAAAAAAAPAREAAPQPAPEAAAPQSTEEQPLVIPIIHEELKIAKRKVDTGGVRIHKSARQEEQTVDVPLVEEHVEVERVPVDRTVDGPVAVRHVGDTIIVPVVEEVLVVQKQLRLVEELHIRKTRTEKHAPQTVVLRKEEATVERLEGDSRES